MPDCDLMVKYNSNILANRTDDYKTPHRILNNYKDYFDPCPFKSEFDGLSIDWKKRNFVNPPYSEKEKWIRKAILEQEKGNTSVLLLPVDTSTYWFHHLVMPNSKIIFLEGRVHFNGSSPPFASMLCIFYPSSIMRSLEQFFEVRNI